MNDIMARVLADSTDRPWWLKARARGIGGSDAAKFSKIESAPSYAHSKLHAVFHGNAATRHGNDREPAILARFNTPQNTLLFHAEGNTRHMATPDGIRVSGMSDEVVLVQVKTTSKEFTRIPIGYLRQVWWEQYVMGATRTLFVWEPHIDGVPVMEPRSEWVDRDDKQISTLIRIADAVLNIVDSIDDFHAEMSRA